MLVFVQRRKEQPALTQNRNREAPHNEGRRKQESVEERTRRGDGVQALGLVDQARDRLGEGARAKM